MSLGQKLRLARQRRGLTQAEAAGDRITRNMLSQIENDLAKPSLPTLQYLAERLEVSVGWLTSEGDGDNAEKTLAEARKLLAAGAYADCLALFSGQEVQDEALLIRALCAVRLARAALERERFEQAAELAQMAAALNERCLYRTEGLAVEASAVLARCAMLLEAGAEQAMEEYRAAYRTSEYSVRHSLLFARYAFLKDDLQAAERAIWSVSDLTEDSRAEYLLLRGQLAMKKEQYETAVRYFHQAETFLPLPRLLERELLRCLGSCYHELGDDSRAYHYRSKAGAAI